MDLNSNSTCKQILEERLVVLKIAFDRLEQKFHQREKWCEILNLWILEQFDFNIEMYWLDLIGRTGVGDGVDPESDDMMNVGVGAGAHGQMFEMQNLGFYTEMPISMEYDDSREAQAQDPLEYLQQREDEETRNEVEFGMNKKCIVPCYTFVDQDERDVEEGGEILESITGGEVESVESSLEIETEKEADSSKRNACARFAASCATGDVTLEHLLSTPPKQGPSTTDIDAIINRLDAASSDLNREQLNEANLNSSHGPFPIIPFSQSHSSGMTNNKSESHNKDQQQIIQLGNQNSANPQQSSIMGGAEADNNCMQFPLTLVPLAIALTPSHPESAAPKPIQSAHPSPQVQAEMHQMQKGKSQPQESGQGVDKIRVGSASSPNSSSISKETHFPCSRCRKKFCSLVAVEAHMKTHRARQREKIGHCEHCGKVYRTLKFFQKHCVTCVMDTNNKKSSKCTSVHSTHMAASDSNAKKSKSEHSTCSASITTGIGPGPATSTGAVKKKSAEPRLSRSKAAKREKALLISNMCGNISKSKMTTASPVSMSAGTGSSVMVTEVATLPPSLGRGSVIIGSKTKKPRSKEINSVQDIASLPTLYEPNADDLVHPSFFRNFLAAGAGVQVRSKPTKSPPGFKSSSSSANKGNLPTPVPTLMKVPADKISGDGRSLDPYDLIPSPAARPNSNSNSNSQSKYHYRSPSEKRQEKSDEEAVLVFNCKVCRLPFPTLEQCRQHIITTHLEQVLQKTPVYLESTATAGAKTPNTLSSAVSPFASRISSTTTTTTTNTTPSVVLSIAQLYPPSAPVSVSILAAVSLKTVTPTTTTIPNLDFHLNDYQQNLSPLHSQFNLNNTATAFPPLSFPSTMLSPTMTTSIGGFTNFTNFADMANLANFSHVAASLLKQAHAQEDSQRFGFHDIRAIASTASATPTSLPTPIPTVIAGATPRAGSSAMATTATAAGNNTMTRPSSSCSSSSLIIDENETLNNVPSPENMYPYICLHCKRLGVRQGFESGQEIHEHILHHHVTTIRFHCPFSFCQQGFLEQNAFEEHIGFHHGMPA